MARPDKTTKKQMRFLDSIRDKYGNVSVDWEGTYQARAVGFRRCIVVAAELPGTEVRTWVIDNEGDVLLEGGAEATA